MKNLLRFLGKELREMLFPAIFFFIVFHLVAFTKHLLLDSYHVAPTDVAIATMSALIAAKAVLIGDAIPLTRRFHSHPLVYSVLWKTAGYWLFFVLLRFAEEILSLRSQTDSFGAAWTKLGEEVSWPLFGVIQIWLIFALLLFTSITEIDRFFGEGTIRRAFLGDKSRIHPADRPPVAGDSITEVSKPAGDLDIFS